jgi:hypothetical protein
MLVFDLLKVTSAKRDEVVRVRLVLQQQLLQK